MGIGKLSSKTIRDLLDEKPTVWKEWLKSGKVHTDQRRLMVNYAKYRQASQELQSSLERLQRLPDRKKPWWSGPTSRFRGPSPCVVPQLPSLGAVGALLGTLPGGP